MSTSFAFCPNCGGNLQQVQSGNSNFCPYCGQRIVIKNNNPGPMENEAVKEVYAAQVMQDREKEEKMRKKNERWRWAVLLGTLPVVALAIFAVFLEEGRTINAAFMLFLPLVVCLFYPFDENWSIGKCIWAWLIRSVVLCIGWFVLVVVIMLILGALMGKL